MSKQEEILQFLSTLKVVLRKELNAEYFSCCKIWRTDAGKDYIFQTHSKYPACTGCIK